MTLHFLLPSSLFHPSPLLKWSKAELLVQFFYFLIRSFLERVAKDTRLDIFQSFPTFLPTQSLTLQTLTFRTFFINIFPFSLSSFPLANSLLFAHISCTVSKCSAFLLLLQWKVITFSSEWIFFFCLCLRIIFQRSAHSSWEIFAWFLIFSQSEIWRTLSYLFFDF